MADIEGLEPELATAFFKKKVFPSIKEYQVESPNFAVVDETSSDEPQVIDILMKCIKQYQIPIQQVSSFTRFYCFVYVKGPGPLPLLQEFLVRFLCDPETLAYGLYINESVNAHGLMWLHKFRKSKLMSK